MEFPGTWELVLILLVIVVVFGSKRLPDSARALGRSMRILKAETKGLHEDDATTTTAHIAAPVTPQPMVGTPVVGAPVVASPVVDPQPFAGQQLFDAQGRPVQLPVNGSPVGGSPVVGSPVGGSQQVQQAPSAQA